MISGRIRGRAITIPTFLTSHTPQMLLKPIVRTFLTSATSTVIIITIMLERHQEMASLMIHSSSSNPHLSNYQWTRATLIVTSKIWIVRSLNSRLSSRSLHIRKFLTRWAKVGASINRRLRFYAQNFKPIRTWWWWFSSSFCSPRNIRSSSEDSKMWPRLATICSQWIMRKSRAISSRSTSTQCPLLCQHSTMNLITYSKPTATCNK